jgi:hypothetical protein
MLNLNGTLSPLHSNPTQGMSPSPPQLADASASTLDSRKDVGVYAYHNHNNCGGNNNNDNDMTHEETSRNAGSETANILDRSNSGVGIFSNSTTTHERNSSSRNSETMTLTQENYSTMMNLTLELVLDLTSVREGDPVYTPYGEGTCIQKQSLKNGSMQVALSFGTLYTQPIMIHKLIDTNTYSEAMNHLEQVRKLQWTMQCEQWNVPLVGREHDCAACLFNKPHWSGENITGNSTSARKVWFRRRPVNNKGSKNTSTPQSAPKHKPCDVCGNPVCPQHTVGNQSSTNFLICVDCQLDLTYVVQKGINTSAKGLLDPNHPQLPQTLDRLLQYYTRMVLQLEYWVPSATKELSRLLTESERSNAKVALGTGSLSFMGAALGVAGAAALMTPVGHAILLAAVATSATSATFQGTHAGVHRFRLRNSSSQLSQVHALSDRLLGWHGLCLGILNSLEELRVLLLSEHESVRSVLHKQATAMAMVNAGTKSTTISLQRNLNMRHTGGKGSSSTKKALEVCNVLAMGGFHTTRHGLTGVVSAISACGHQHVFGDSISMLVDHQLF